MGLIQHKDNECLTTWKSKVKDALKLLCYINT